MNKKFLFNVFSLIIILSLCIPVSTAPGKKRKIRNKGSVNVKSRLIRNRLMLNSRQFVPKRGIDKRLIKELRKKSKKRVHVFIQFDKIPDLELRKTLKKKLDIKLLNTVPDKAYYASVPGNVPALTKIIKSNSKVRWIGLIRDVDKVSLAISRKGRVPDYTRRKGKEVELVILFFGDVPETVQKATLENLGATILERWSPVNAWLILSRESRVKYIAREDSVRFIEEGPPPPEYDNDGARSATGANSDSVSPPDEYGLTGAGVTVGHWEPDHASTTHPDYAANVTVGDGPIPINARNWMHDESVAVNGQFDNGESIYADMDDSQTVTAQDMRFTANASGVAGNVLATDGDVGVALVRFLNTRFNAADARNEMYEFQASPGGFFFTGADPVYDDVDGNFIVSVGDIRLSPVGAFAVGTTVAIGDADIFTPTPAATINLLLFELLPHYHSTHTAGTVIGNGSLSIANGGSANQWKGVAPNALLRIYNSALVGTGEYADAVANGANISTNSWGQSHYNKTSTVPSLKYSSRSSLYDAIISGRQSDGSLSGVGAPVTILGSAGNNGRPERHADDLIANGQYDNGESIYYDFDDSGTVSASDTRRLGAVQPVGTALVNFQFNERHDESISTSGLYNPNEGIYRDVDGDQFVSINDVRITVNGFATGSVVVGADADLGVYLRPFKLWGNIRVSNSAKNTLSVANITSDTKTPSASSSRGPTGEGRIKPDLAGPGSQAGGDGGIRSPNPRVNGYWDSDYKTITGTSMSTPATAGVAALLTEWYRTSCLPGGTPVPATLRALLIHGAEDLTNIPNVGAGFNGPDYSFGYGRVDTHGAVRLIPHHLTATAAATGDTDYTVTMGERGELKVTLVWDDPAWATGVAPSAITGILQNDLDLLLIAPDGTQYTPWVLNPSNPSAPATRTSFAIGVAVNDSARDHRNTVEQITVPNAMAGDWIIRVTASTLNQPAQNYTIVSESISPQFGPCTGLTAGGDIWIRDNTNDTGIIPSTGYMWQGPDIWNRIADDNSTDHQNPEYGQTNYLRAIVRNQGTTTVAATTAQFWIADASVGLSWPTTFRLVGTVDVANLAPGEVRTVGPLEWDPPMPVGPIDHHCMLVRIMSPQDPITIPETGGILFDSRNSTNIAYTNMDIVDLASDRTVSFFLRNVKNKDADVELVVEAPPEFLSIGKAEIVIEDTIEKRWKSRKGSHSGFEVARKPIILEQNRDDQDFIKNRKDQKQVENRWEKPELPLVVNRSLFKLKTSKAKIRNIPLKARETVVLRITFGSKQKKKAHYDINVYEKINGKIVGGMTFRVRTGYK